MGVTKAVASLMESRFPGSGMIFPVRHTSMVELHSVSSRIYPGGQLSKNARISASPFRMVSSSSST